MNKCIFTGRLTKDPETRQSQNGMTITRFSIAVDRMKTKDNQNPGADFLNCVAFGARGEFVSKYFHKGDKIIMESHVQTGSYDGQNGKVYTTDFIVDSVEFGQSKGAVEQSQPTTNTQPNDFVNLPVGIEEELPFV